MGMAVQIGGQEQDVYKLLVPARNAFETQKIMSRLSANKQVPFAIVCMMQRKTKSKVLKILLEELYQNQMAYEGQARGEICEVAAVKLSNDEFKGGLL